MSNNFEQKIFLFQEDLDFLSGSLFTDEFPTLIENIEKPKYSISDLKISPRDASYWDKQGVLPIVKGPGMRRKYDLIQSVWIKLIQQMRSLGIGLGTVKKLKDNLLEPKIDLANFDQDALKKIINEINEKYNSSVSSEQLIFEIKENGPSIFKSMVIATIVFKKSFHCIVNKEGDFLLYDSLRYQELFLKDTDFTQFVTEPYFCLNLAEAYKNIVKDWTTETMISNTYLLSKIEMTILESIRRKDVNSVTIRYKDGEPDLIEVNEQNIISAEHRFLDVIMKNGFQKISVSTRNGKIVNYENKVQIKLKKSTK